MGGMVLETNMSEILTHVEAQNKMEKSESSPTSTIRVNKYLVVVVVSTLWGHLHCLCIVSVIHIITMSHSSKVAVHRYVHLITFCLKRVYTLQS